MGEVELSAASLVAPNRYDTPGQRRSFIVGLSGLQLRDEEAVFLADHKPCGIIIFTRNYADDAQLRRLIDMARRAAGGADMLVLVDQEGGRVQRLRGPDWPDLPAAARFGALYETDPAAALIAARAASHWLGGLLRGVGINTNCVPCLDVPVAGADAIIGDRAYGCCPEVVTALGGAVAAGALDAGVVPVMKHIPGHGRAGVDSHLALPVVDADLEVLRRQDFAPFAAHRGLPAAMSAHVTYRAVDDEAPASVSAKMIGRIIRDNIGFDGLLMSDDVSMQALAGTIGERAKAVVSAGCDLILHCNGNLEEMIEVATVAPQLEGEALRRYQHCLDIIRQPARPFDCELARAALERVRRA